MLPTFTKVSWLRTATLIWAMAWIMMVPLFHVHPDADHSHGNIAHAHASTVHTVFSPDLDGEFHTHQDTTDGSGHNSSSQIAFSGHPAHQSEPSEFGFSVISNSIDRKLTKPVFSHGLINESPVLRKVPSRPSVSADNGFPPLHIFLTRDIPSRAPPSLLV